MPFTPENSAIKLNAEQERTIAQMPADEIGEYLKNLAVEQNLVERDWDPTLFIEKNAPTPKRYARAITVNGQRHVLEAESEQGLQEREIAFYRSVFSGDNGGQPQESARTAEPSAVHEATENDSVLDSYMKSIGIDPDERRNKQFEQSWAAATQEFVQRHSDWEGGSANLESMKSALVSLGLADKPSVESLELAFQEIVRTEQYYENPTLEAQRAIGSANDPESLRAAAHRSVGLPEHLSTRTIDELSWR